MTNISRWILVLGILLAIPPRLFAQSAAVPIENPPWAVTSAPARFVIDPGSSMNPNPLVSWIDLLLPDSKWATMPIRVYTDTGTPVGAELVWTAPGEPSTILFDSSSGARRYQVYLGSNLPAMPIPDSKAGVRLETREGDGKTITSLPDMLQAWKQSTKVLGRAVSREIYEGGNRFGPQGNLLLHFQGWFEVTAPEHLLLAIISTDATFVLVDGKEVVEWPGLHDFRPGLNGEHQGAVDLSPGIHSLDYYNAYVQSPNGQPPVFCCLAIKGGSFADWTTHSQDTSFFKNTANFAIHHYGLQANLPGGVSIPGTPPLAIECSIAEQSIIYSDLPDLGLISMQFMCRQDCAGDVTWTFDDGSTAQGQKIIHLFPRPGMRTVHVSIKDKDKEVASLTQTINIHPDWAHIWHGPVLRPEDEADIMGRDPATLSVSDLAGCFAVFTHYLRSDDLLKLLPSVCARMNAFNDNDLPYIKDGAMLLAQEDWAHSTEAIQLLRALIDRPPPTTPSPQSATIAGECRLALARLLLKTSDHTDEVRTLLDAINPTTLTGDDSRALGILRADLALATGDVLGARKQYEALTGQPSGPDIRSSIRRTAKISQARAYLDRKDFGAAEDSLNEVVWQEPIQKISPDWALTRLRLFQEQNLAVPAYLWAKRLLPVVLEGGRSELLFRLTDLAFAQKDNALAHKTLSELLKKHPYSEEAAQAKEKWPGQDPGL